MADQPSRGFRAPKLPRELVRKYDVAGPRYTSYPTAPQFHSGHASREHAAALAESNREAAPLSLYVHLPFCESVCYFCGCNVTFTKDRSRPAEYLELVLKELELMRPLLRKDRPVIQMHWGGGTPTFFPAPLLARLGKELRNRFDFAPDAEIGVEIDPRETSTEHLDALAEAGFNRLSMGVQDFDPKVQEAVHRIQPEELTRATIEAARKRGFTSINVDLMYGLPHQTQESFDRTVDTLLSMSPDRIACFNFAYLPEMIKHQRAIPKAAMPEPEKKLDILESAVARLTDAGYGFVGMDHFAKPDDELFRAIDERTLWRNFQGYSTRAGADLVALGVSAISQVGPTYAQNRKQLEEYRRELAGDRLPVFRGVAMSADDLLRRDVITRLMCHFVLHKKEVEAAHGIRFDETFGAEIERLRELEPDGLVTVHDDRIEVLPVGRLLVRNVAMCFDAYLRRPEAAGQKFSRTV